MQPRLLAVILLLLYALVIMCGCVHSHAHVATPSNAAVQHGLSDATAQNKSALGHNAQAMTAAQRIDAKDRIIDQWYREHHQ